MPNYTAHRRKSTWTSKRKGKLITMRATKKTWQVKHPTVTRQQIKLKRPRASIHKIEITEEGELWRAVAKDGYGNRVKGAFDLDVREVAKTATEWQKRHKFKGQEVPITFPDLKKRVEKK